MELLLQHQRDHSIFLSILLETLYECSFSAGYLTDFNNNPFCPVPSSSTLAFRKHINLFSAQAEIIDI